MTEVSWEQGGRLVDRLRGQYALGAQPECGFKQFEAPPIQQEAADRIEALETALRKWRDDNACTAASTAGDVAMVLVPAHEIDALLGNPVEGDGS